MKGLWKGTTYLCIYLLFLMTAAIPAYSEVEEKKVDLKISGGLSYLGVGDWNTSSQGWNDSSRDLRDLTAGTLNGEYKILHWSRELAGDLMFNLNPQLAASVGAGYIWLNEGGDSSKITLTSNGITNTNTHDTKISAVPLTAGIHYFLPVSSGAKAFLSAGAGYYFAKLTDDYRFEDDTGVWFTRNTDTKSSGFGFHGGVGFEYSLSQSVAIIVEGYGRYAKIGGFEGTEDVANSTGWSDSGEGTLYIYQEDRGTGWYPVVFLEETMPSAANVRNVKEAKVDFSGFTIRIGLKFKLF